MTMFEPPLRRRIWQWNAFQDVGNLVNLLKNLVRTWTDGGHRDLPLGCFSRLFASQTIHRPAYVKNVEAQLRPVSSINPQLLLPIGIGVGVVIVIAIIWRLFRRKNRKKRS